MYSTSGDRTGLLRAAASLQSQSDNEYGMSGSSLDYRFSSNKRPLPPPPPPRLQGRAPSTDDDSDDDMYSDAEEAAFYGGKRGGGVGSALKWEKEDDDLLRSLVEQYGTKHWNHISQRLPGRTGKQCR